jgi:hypothetical protein
MIPRAGLKSAIMRETPQIPARLSEIQLFCKHFLMKRNFPNVRTKMGRKIVILATVQSNHAISPIKRRKNKTRAVMDEKKESFEDLFGVSKAFSFTSEISTMGIFTS